MLSGELAVDPPTQARRYWDLVTRNWKRSLFTAAGLVRLSLAGKRKPDAGRLFHRKWLNSNLQAGTPVIVGGGDVQLGLFGAGRRTLAQRPCGGTFWQQVVNLPAPVTDPNMNVNLSILICDPRYGTNRVY